MTVNRTQFTALLEPILNNIRNDQDYPRVEKIYTQLYDMVESSKKAKETDFQRAGLGDFQVKNEGGPISFDDPIAGNTLEYAHVRSALGYKVTQEMFDHDQFAEIRKLEKDLQIAGDDHLEVRGNLLLNSGFGTTNSQGFRATGFDGLSLFSTAHTRLDGGASQGNRPATDINLGWTALADAILQFQLWVDNRGRIIRPSPSKLIVHPNDSLTAMELLQSSLKPGTANNEINAIRGDLSVLVNPYLTDSNSWFVKASGGTDTRWFWDVAPRTATLDEDQINEISGRKRVQGFSHGHGDWVGYYGTSGTT